MIADFIEVLPDIRVNDIVDIYRTTIPVKDFLKYWFI